MKELNIVVGQDAKIKIYLTEETIELMNSEQAHSSILDKMTDFIIYSNEMSAIIENCMNRKCKVGVTTIDSENNYNIHLAKVWGEKGYILIDTQIFIPVKVGYDSNLIKGMMRNITAKIISGDLQQSDFDGSNLARELKAVQINVRNIEFIPVKDKELEIYFDTNDNDLVPESKEKNYQKELDKIGTVIF